MCRSPEVVSVGEDGRVILYKADQTEVVRVIGKCFVAFLVELTKNIYIFSLPYAKNRLT